MLVRKNFWFYFFITLIICLGIIFRLVNLDKKVYWHDEVHTSLRVAGYSSTQEIFTGEIITAQQLLEYQKLQDDRDFREAMTAFQGHPEHPPLYYILQRFWQKIFGSSITATRSLSAVFSILTLPLIYWLTWQLFGSIQISLISVSLFAVSPIFVLYAQEARQYSLWTLTTILNSIFFLRAIKSEQLSNWWLYLLSLVINFYTCLLSPFVLAIQSIYLALIKGFNFTKVWLRFILFSLLGIISFLPWLWIVITKYESVKGVTNWLKQDQSFTSLLKNWGDNLVRIFTDFSWAIGNFWSYLLIICFYLFTGLSIFFLIKYYPRKIWVYLILFTAFPFLFLAILDLISGTIRSTIPRYIIPYYVGIIIIFASAISANMAKAKTAKISALIYGLIILLGIISNLYHLQKVTWWNKGLGYEINYIAQKINQSEKPLIINEKSGISAGIMMSLSHSLNPDVNLQLVEQNISLSPQPQFKNIFVINSSPEFREKVEFAYGKKLEGNYQQLIFTNPSVYYLENNH